MGMFDTDKEIGLKMETAFEQGEPFILWAAEVASETVNAQPGLPPARKTLLQVSKMKEPDQQFEIATLASAIADKAEKATADDFPCIVSWEKVHGRFDKAGEKSTTALQWRSDYKQ